MKSPLSVTVSLQVLCCISVALLRLSSSQVDLTIEPESRGTAVTLAAIDRITLSGVFPADNRFLRRVAYVETRDGVDPDTYREGYNGGIWQVDENIFAETINTGAHPELIAIDGIYLKILDQFGIDWAAAQWEDLRRPFISALAARIYFELVATSQSIDNPEPIPPTGDLLGQADYWKRRYNNNSADTVQDFIDAVDELELEACPVRALDLAFVFDSSGSVGRANFELEKDYAINVAQLFTIGPENTQISAIPYSGFAKIAFLLNTFDNITVISQALKSIEFFDIPGQGRPSTNTADALERLRSDVFTEAGGARDAIFGVPRVAVVLTDGRSNVNRELTIPNAQALHADGVQVFAVGVGGRVSQDELNGIASSPEFVINIDGFDVTAFVGLERMISAEACFVPAPIDIEQGIETLLELGELSFFQLQVPLEGMTIQLQQQTGEVVLYTSKIIRNPNSAFYDEKIEGKGAVFISPNKTSEEDKIVLKRAAADDDLFSETIVYVTIEGVGNENIFILNTTFGNTVPIPSSSNSWRTPVIISVTLVGVALLLVLVGLLAIFVGVKVITRKRSLKSSKESNIQSSREMLTERPNDRDRYAASPGDVFMQELATKQVILKGHGVITGSGQYGDGAVN